MATGSGGAMSGSGRAMGRDSGGDRREPIVPPPAKPAVAAGGDMLIDAAVEVAGAEAAEVAAVGAGGEGSSGAGIVTPAMFI